MIENNINLLKIIKKLNIEFELHKSFFIIVFMFVNFICIIIQHKLNIILLYF